MIDDPVFVAQLKEKKTQEQAFKILVSNYKECLYWHIRRIVLHHDDADDVLQDTFIKIYRNINGFKGESALYSWIYRIATNEALSFLKSKARKYHITTEALHYKMVGDLTSDNYFEGTEIQLKLQKAIAQLPEKQQLVFNMKYFGNMTYKELSAILNTSVGALKASYHHAVKKIEAYITDI